DLLENLEALVNRLGKRGRQQHGVPVPLVYLGEQVVRVRADLRLVVARAEVEPEQLRLIRVIPCNECSHTFLHTFPGRRSQTSLRQRGTGGFPRCPGMERENGRGGRMAIGLGKTGGSPGPEYGIDEGKRRRPPARMVISRLHGSWGGFWNREW